MGHPFDCLVIGAGMAGAICARELAERGGKKVLVLERRDHVGGNAYDCLDGSGVLIHQYGPHIFHTNSRRVFEYLSRFTAWRMALSISPWRRAAACRSRAAIMARSMGIPAICRLGEGMAVTAGGHRAVLDAEQGTLTVDPTAEQTAAARRPVVRYAFPEG